MEKGERKRKREERQKKTDVGNKREAHTYVPFSLLCPPFSEMKKKKDISKKGTPTPTDRRESKPCTCGVCPSSFLLIFPSSQSFHLPLPRPLPPPPYLRPSSPLSKQFYHSCTWIGHATEYAGHFSASLTPFLHCQNTHGLQRRLCLLAFWGLTFLDPLSLSRVLALVCP